jgi:hypothetical protein
VGPRNPWLDGAVGPGYGRAMPQIELRAADGHVFHAHRIDPEGTPRGGVVVVQARAGGEVGYGFDCDHRKDFQADAAAAALQRTLGFFAQHLG